MSRKATLPPPPASPKQDLAQSQTKSARVDPVIAAIIQRVKAGGRPSVDEARFVFGNDAYIRVTLIDATPAAIEQLRKAGLVVTKTEGAVVSGHIPLAALEALSQLPIVASISPR